MAGWAKRDRARAVVPERRGARPAAARELACGQKQGKEGEEKKELLFFFQYIFQSHFQINFEFILTLNQDQSSHK